MFTWHDPTQLRLINMLGGPASEKGHYQINLFFIKGFKTFFLLQNIYVTWWMCMHMDTPTIIMRIYNKSQSSFWEILFDG